MRYRAADGSLAAKELANANLGEEVRNTLSLAMVSLHASEDYLYSLSQLLVEPVSQFGFMPVARSAMEASARAWWLLDPGIEVSTRVARGLTERLHNVHEQIKILREFNVDLSSQQERLGIIFESAQRWGLNLVVDKNGQPIAVGERRPTTTGLIGRLSDSAYLDEAVAVGVYRLFSGGAHAVFYALKEGFEYLEDPEGRHDRLAVPKVSLDAVEMPASVALLIWVAAMDRAVGLYGWKRNHWDSWKQHALKVGVIRRLKMRQELGLVRAPDD